MPARIRRLALAIPLLLLLVGAATPPRASEAASTYTRDLYFSAGYERQIDNRTCIPASTAMMMNFIARRDLNLSQRTILRFAQPRDALRDSVQRGSDPLGWAKAATAYSIYTGKRTTYQWEAYSSESAALNRAATLIAKYGKPVGLLVQHGKHAIVMTGFTSTRNPTRGNFRLLKVIYSDPYGSRHASVNAAYSPLNTYLELDATTTYDRLWYGKYIIVAPQN
ncbi:MAG TPA: C39 family peptidase [Candidatus Limnocylindrales bacterium]|nr:C39 family peptidase [Candidatus Limnocylindrales bacterium]